MTETTAGSTGAEAQIELDAEGRRLQLEAEKAKFREAIRTHQKGAQEASAGAIKAAMPALVDAPKGEVTLEENAGALGPWRAHEVLYALARWIARDARTALAAGTGPVRVLVVSDRSIVADSWTAAHTAMTLGRLQSRLQGLDAVVDSALTDLRAQLEDLLSVPMGVAAQEEDELHRAAVGVRLLLPAGEPAPSPPSAAITAEGTATATPAAGATAGAFGAAVDLMGLLRTDYTLTPTPVTTTPHELVTLTAAALIRPPVEVVTAEQALAARLTAEVDDLATVSDSPSLTALGALQETRDALVRRLFDLAAELAPASAELTPLRSRIAEVEKAWATAVSAETPTGEPLRQALELLLRRAYALDQAVAPAQSLLASVQQVIIDVDEGIASLLAVPEGGEAPLLTTARRERLGAAVVTNRITHILHVNADSLVAEAITRRSILGMTGRIQYTAAGNTSWLLVRTSDSSVVSGGQPSLGDVLTFDLDKGRASYATPPGLPNVAALGADPLRRLELWAKALVAVMVLVLLVIGGVGAIAMIDALAN